MESTVVVSSGVIRGESDLKRIIWTVSEPQIDGSQKERGGMLWETSAVSKKKWGGKGNDQVCDIF